MSNFSLFARLMNDRRFEGLLFGDISAVIQRNRRASVLKALLETEDWHERLVNGSDYPLPGVVPLISLRKLRARGFLPEVCGTGVERSAAAQRHPVRLHAETPVT